MPCDRREFLASAAALAALTLWPDAHGAAHTPLLGSVPRTKKPALVRGAFFYPPLEVVERGECEDGWSQHYWSTWPGNQFAPEQQQAEFMARVREMARGLDLEIVIDKAPLYTDAGIQAFMQNIAETKPAALLLFNFWNSFSAKIAPILDAYNSPIILYHALGANHQLPPEKFRTAPRVQYIHSIEHWDALDRGLRAVHTKVRLDQSRLLRVSGRLEKEADDHEAFFDMPIHGVPAGHFNDLFDSIEVTRDMRRLASKVRRNARHVHDLSEEAFLDAVRSHVAVLELMDRHEADAITIECLFLKHRKPCLSFALNNGALVPCGCENDLNATLTLMMGTALCGRGGFQHNPEFDTEENLYFGAHCTCTPKLHGPDARAQAYDLRPFFHQLPKTLALDVQWPEGEPVTLCKYYSGEKRLAAWAGESVSSPGCPPSGGCASRVLVKVRDIEDVCTIYPGPHPVLICGEFGRHFKTFAKLYEMDIATNC